MKALIRILALLVFTVGLTFSIGASWTTKHIYDGQGFVDSTAAIGQNDQVRSTLINVASVQLAAKAQVGPTLSGQISSATTRVLTQLADKPEFDAAWRESMRRSHDLHFFSAEKPEVLTINFAPFIDMAIDESRALSLLGVSAPNEILVEVPSLRVSRAVEATSWAAEYRLPAYGVTAMAGLIVLLTSRRRMLGTSLLLLGAISVVVAAVSALAVRIAAGRAADAALTDYREFAGVIRPASEMAVESIDAFLWPVAAIGLAVAGAGIVWRVISARQR